MVKISPAGCLQLCHWMATNIPSACNRGESIVNTNTKINTETYTKTITKNNHKEDKRLATSVTYASNRPVLQLLL